MKLEDIVKLFDKSNKRFYYIGKKECGVLIGLDLEGRLFAVLNGRIINKINTEAIIGQSHRKKYINPGGDGLWPAPEGTCFGYEYPAGEWRVPPSLTGARYRVVTGKPNYVHIIAEIDLINNMGLGIPTVFERRISVKPDGNKIQVKSVESITYIGTKTLTAKQCMLAPWTLCQFDCGPECEVVFPGTNEAEKPFWDLYDPSDEKRIFDEEGLWHTRTDGGPRYQIGIDPSVDYIEFRDPSKDLLVRRTADLLPDDLKYIDIIDAPPNEKPADVKTRFSVYSDPSLFMEIEAAGGCPQEWAPKTVSAVTVYTDYSVDPNFGASEG